MGRSAASTTRRPYNRTLRVEQGRQMREATRVRILDGLVRVLARDAAALSVAGVAAEAGVSVPTVYRYFRSRDELVAALPDHIATKIHLDLPVPHSPAELAERVRTAYLRGDEALRAALATEIGARVRRRFWAEDAERVAVALEPVADRLDGEDYERLRSILVLLANSQGVELLRGRLGLSAAAAADTIAWAIVTLCDGAARKGGPARNERSKAR
jgi:AcrR family transcriptional regulator